MASEWPGPWAGRLTTEWTDRGLSENQLATLRHSGLLFIVTLAFVLYLSAIPGQTIARDVVAAALILEPLHAAWMASHCHRGRAMKLDLDPDRMRLSSGAQTIEVPREDLYRITRVVSSREDEFARVVRIWTRSGRTVDIVDRLVRITAVPFAFDRAGIDRNRERIPLAVVLGTWWADPESRATIVERGSGKGRIPVTMTWGQPDLGGYRRWRARVRWRESTFLLAVAVALVVIYAAVRSNAALMAPFPLGSVGAGALVGLLIAIATANAWWRRRTVRRLMEPGPRGIRAL
jgi:hypothetical protein